MPYDREKHHRRSIRLKDYNYSKPGAYYVTICVHDRECLFGTIANGVFQTNEFGKIVEKCWRRLPYHYSNIKLDAFVIMPNHVHGIIIINNRCDADAGSGFGFGFGRGRFPRK